MSCGSSARAEWDEVADIVVRSQRLRHLYGELAFVVDAPAGPMQGISIVHPNRLGLTTNSALRPVVRQTGASSPQRFATVVFDHAIGPPWGRTIVCDFGVVNNSTTTVNYVYAQVSHDCQLAITSPSAPKASCNGW